MTKDDRSDRSALSGGLGAGAESCPTCGSDCNERDELIKAEREIERLRAERNAAVRDLQERCAKVCEEYATWGGSKFYEWFMKAAAEIRAIDAARQLQERKT